MLCRFELGTAAGRVAVMIYAVFMLCRFELGTAAGRVAVVIYAVFMLCRFELGTTAARVAVMIYDVCMLCRFELGTAAGRVAVMIYDAAGWYNLIPFAGYTGRDDLYNQIDNLQLIERTDYADNAVGKSNEGQSISYVNEPMANSLFKIRSFNFVCMNITNYHIF